ncbi:hypothetical protein AB3N02_21930 [Priestia aryabhattai]|uniref:hypothetical protein n=1 Tax=Priestia aryabhattai TaxID=412384 RepID=UPI0039A20EF9
MIHYNQEGIGEMPMEMFTKDELLAYNELMLGRGVPNQDDGIGYNKGDFGACTTYYNGLSDAQYADLAKRLVKYTKTQLKIDRDKMIRTAEHLATIASNADRSDGITVDAGEDGGVLISYRYNYDFTEKIKELKICRWNGSHWIAPNTRAIEVLKHLEDIGADVENAIQWIQDNVSMEEQKTEVLTKFREDTVCLKFNYHKDIVEKIKEIKKEDRRYSQEYKYWEIKSNYLDWLKQSLEAIAQFKTI